MRLRHPPLRRAAARPLLLTLTVALTITLAACQRSGGIGPAPGSGASVLKIGGVGPLSQPGAVQAGQDMQWAMRAAVADVNREDGVLGKTVQLVFADTEGRPDTAGSVARKLVEFDQVAGVVGEYHSSAALAQIPVYREYGTPFVVVDAYADAITAGDPDDPGLPAEPRSVFRIAPTNGYDVQLHADWLTRGLRARKVVQIYEATDYGIGQANAMRERLDGAGVTLAQVKIELNQPDYTPILSRVRQEHPDADAVVFSVTGETSYVAVGNAFAAGLLGSGQDRACVANQAAQDHQAFWRAVPDGAGCVFRVAGPMPARYGPTARQLADRYTQEFGNAPKAWVFESYDAVRLLADAIERAGTDEPAAVVAALESTSFEGVQGTYRFPYGSTRSVPAGQPGWLWHQWPEPAIQLAQYTAPGQALTDAAVVWPPDRQTHRGTAYFPSGQPSLAAEIPR